LLTSVEILDACKLSIFVGFIAIAPFAIADPTPASGTGNRDSTQPVTSTNQPVVDPNSVPTSATNAAGVTNQATSGTATGLGNEYSSDAENSEDDHEISSTAKRSKPNPKEKMIEVDSVQKLRTSGVDGRFQGSLLDSVDPLRDVELAPERKKTAPPEDPRFKTKHLSLVQEMSDQQKKTAPAQPRADASPSPSPSASPTASASSKSSSDRNR
jgi:hypothetical protein